MMKKFVLLCYSLLLLSSMSLAQNDVAMNGKGPYIDIVRSGQWGFSGFGGVNNNYMFIPSNPDQSICIFFRNNNPSNSHSFTLNVFQTGDSRIKSFTPNQGAFIQDSVIGNASPIAPLSTSSVFVHTNAGALVVIQIINSISAGGSPDTLDAYIVQTNATSCGTAASGNTTSQLPKIVFFNGASATSTQTSQYIEWNFGTPISGTIFYNFSNATGSPSSCFFTMKTIAEVGNVIAIGGLPLTIGTSGSLNVSGNQNITFMQPSAINSNIDVASADKVALTYSCGVYPTTGFMYATFVPSANINYGLSGAGTASFGPFPQIACTSTQSQNVPAASTVRIIIGVASTNLYVCGYAVTTEAAATTGGAGIFQHGTGTNCATGTQNDWRIGIPVGIQSTSQINVWPLWSTGTNDVCFQNNAVGGSVDVSINYTVLP